MATVRKQNKPKREMTKICVKCYTKKKFEFFYKMKSPMYPDGYLPMCSDCFCQDVDINDLNHVKHALHQLNLPYLKTEWKNLSSNKQVNALRSYIRMVKSLPQYSKLTWKDSDDADDIGSISNVPIVVTDLKVESSTVVAEDLVNRWGIGYKPEEYESFEKKYQFLKNNYPELTSMHTESLFKYIRYSVKEELAIAAGLPGEAKTWGELAMKAATNAKINPSQLSKSDLQGGLNSFSELFKEVEKAVDVIQILPKFKFRPNDALDFIMWCYINYVRDMKSLPPCEYEEIYKFYDIKKQEYIEQYGDPYGIFKEDTTEENRGAIKKFIYIPQDIKDGDPNV
jgi:hypothetical protein